MSWDLGGLTGLSFGDFLFALENNNVHYQDKIKATVIIEKEETHYNANSINWSYEKFMEEGTGTYEEFWFYMSFLNKDYKKHHITLDKIKLL